MESSPFHDAETLAQILSLVYDQNAPLPDYYITGFGLNNRSWRITEVEEPLTKIMQFLPYCRYPDSMKKNIFYKAQRVDQAATLTQILCNFFINKTLSKNLYYRGKLVASVNLQWVTVSGYKNPIMEEWEKTLLPVNNYSFPVVNLITSDNEEVFIDLCSTQIDVNNYDENNVPFLVLHKLTVGAPYASELNKNVIITSMEAPVPVVNDSNYNNFIEMLQNDFGEEVRNYTEYLYKTYKDLVQKKCKAHKKTKNKRKNNKRKNHKKGAIKEDDSEDDEIALVEDLETEETESPNKLLAQIIGNSEEFASIPQAVQDIMIEGLKDLAESIRTEVHTEQDPQTYEATSPPVQEPETTPESISHDKMD
jgi:hypothetical protein